MGYQRYGPVLVALTLLLSVPAAVAVQPPTPPHLARLDSLLAGSAYEEVLVQGQALEPADKLDEAYILDRLVEAAYRSRHVMEDPYPEMGRRAVALKEEVLPPDDPAIGNSLQQLGNLLTRRWELDEAQQVYRRAADIFARAGADYAGPQAMSLVGLGVARKRQGDRLAARDLYLRALALQEEHLDPEDPNIASTLNNLGTIEVELGDYSQTLAYHRRALAIREAALGPDHEWVAETLNNLASVLGYLGQFEEALEAQERAIRIFTEKLGPDHQRTWVVRFNLAVLYQDMGNFEGTIPICEDVLARQRERYGDVHFRLSYTLDALAFAHMGLEQYERALEYCNESVAIAEALYGEGNLDTAYSITQRGQCLAAMGRMEEAAEELQRSLEIRMAAGEGDNAGMCKLLMRLGDLHLARGDFEAADSLARRILAIGEAELGWDHPYLTAARLMAGRAARGRGHRDEALTLACESEQSSRSHLRKTMRVLSESRALDYAASRTTGLDLACSLLENGQQGAPVERVWDEMVRSRGMVLDEFTRRNQDLRNEGDEILRALADSSRVVRERLANLTLRGAGWEEPQEYSAMLRRAEERFEDLERRLMRRRVDLGRPTRHATGLQEVRAALPGSRALVAYTRYDRCAPDGDPEQARPAYMAFVLPAAGEPPVAVDLGPAGTIDEAVRRWRWEIRYGAESAEGTRGIVQVSGDSEVRRQQYREAARDLARLVWDPVRRVMGRPEGVFLVPAGQLYLVSFPSLVDDEGRFLIESAFVTHLLPGERALTTPELDRAGSGLLAIGGPDFGSAGMSVEGAGGFDDLPHTHTEVDRIGAIWRERGGEPEFLKGAAAREAAVKNRAAGHEVLHFATHGFFRTEDGPTSLSRWNHALTHSGLALAGANEGKASGADDGILTAQEVAALDLRGVRWAVLSACDTGLGDVDHRGEGVHGLRRVFQLAGARTVIMSLWAIPDEWTRFWMENLYEMRWGQGLDTADSMREATRRTLADRRDRGLSDHPYFWAGFVAAGDWR